MSIKKIFVGGLISSIIIFFPIRSASAEEKKSFHYDVRITEWASKANASWQISFPVQGGGVTESELNYENLDSDITIVEARIKTLEDFSIGINVGGGEIDGGKFTDTDRTDGWVWSESTGKVDGTTMLWGANLYLNLAPKEEPRSGWLDLFVGYQHYEDELRMFSGQQNISEAPKSTTAIGPFSGLNSTYDFEWDYAQIGTQAGFSFISEPEPWLYNLGMSASLGLMPIVHYEGTGVWNLRSSYAQDPSFRHKSNSGWGVDANIAFNYSPHERVDIALGYRYFYLEAKNGTDTTYFADGTSSVASLDEVKVTRQGPFISLAVWF